MYRVSRITYNGKKRLKNLKKLDPVYVILYRLYKFPNYRLPITDY